MSERPLTPPIFIAEGHDVMAFRDAAAAELKLEDIDVDDGVYEGWDADGRILQLQTVPAFGHVGARSVRITASDSDVTHSDRLRERLAAILSTSAGRLTAGKSLPEVVDIFVKWAGYTS